MSEVVDVPLRLPKDVAAGVFAIAELAGVSVEDVIKVLLARDALQHGTLPEIVPG